MTFWANFTHISMRHHKSSLFYVSTFQNNHPYLVDYGKFFIIFNILFPTVVWNYLSFILLFSIYFRIVYLMFDFGSNINFLWVFFVSFFFPCLFYFNKTFTNKATECEMKFIHVVLYHIYSFTRHILAT